MVATQYLYEMSGGECYGYFSGKYLYTMNGSCTHFRAGSGDRYLFTMAGGDCEFYQSGKYFYEMGGSCRWWLHPYD